MSILNTVKQLTLRKPRQNDCVPTTIKFWRCLALAYDVLLTCLDNDCKYRLQTRIEFFTEFKIVHNGHVKNIQFRFWSTFCRIEEIWKKKKMIVIFWPPNTNIKKQSIQLILNLQNAISKLLAHLHHCPQSWNVILLLYYLIKMSIGTYFSNYTIFAFHISIPLPQTKQHINKSRHRYGLQCKPIKWIFLLTVRIDSVNCRQIEGTVIVLWPEKWTHALRRCGRWPPANE